MSGIAIYLSQCRTPSYIANAMGIRAALGVIVVLLILGFVITQSAVRMAHRSGITNTLK